MTNTKILIGALVTAIASFSLGLGVCSAASENSQKTYDQAVTAFNEAPNKAEKLQALSIMKNIDLKEYGTKETKKLNQFHECMYRMTLQSDSTTSYNTIFEACI